MKRLITKSLCDPDEKMHGAEESMLRHLFPCISCVQTVMDLHVVVFVV